MIGDFFIVFVISTEEKSDLVFDKDWRFSLRPEASRAGLAPKK
jgi:hypothetical protein